MGRLLAHRCRRGVTLVELLVSIMLLVLIVSVVVPAVRASAPPPADSPQLRLMSARRAALSRGEATTIDWMGDGGSRRPVTIWPDGHITTDSSPGIEWMTGQPDTVRHPRALQVQDTSTRRRR